MVTIYDILEVNENASKEEIEKSYQRLILEYHKDPKLDEEANHDNEIILNKLKLAYDILSDDEKRKKYDKDLAQKRAEELIKNVTVKTTPTDENNNFESEQNSNEIKNENIKYSQSNNKVNDNDKYNDENEVTLSKDEKYKVRKAAQKEFKANLKKAQKAEEEYNKAYNEAYNNYLRKMGFNVKEPWTLKRVKNVVITLLVIIIVCALIWIIPPTRKILVGIYEENFIIKSLVDLVAMFFKAIISIFK